ncbi:hypothetical protein RHS04_00861 [Rhizoctonia solani]|uniref:Uncharacterized protein n=1 Tax=Rhizoctonia solani TaxID=456999 RepID=A0A8H7LNL8_9AGAM|nr:hypothetical protein RHS04_00861 [Rhizoctonia solani]
MSEQDGAICGGCCGKWLQSSCIESQTEYLLSDFLRNNFWSMSETFGAGNGRDSCCGGPRGCCHSCFSGGFDEDSWDKKDAADRNRAQAAANSSQPAPTPQMDPTTPPVDSSQAK